MRWGKFLTLLLGGGGIPKGGMIKNQLTTDMGTSQNGPLFVKLCTGHGFGNFCAARISCFAFSKQAPLARA